ncbi:MAG: adenosylcobalamin-dependent ribonucleoside-diphosphate reductase [Gammaproteobacteria bacterium]
MTYFQEPISEKVWDIKYRYRREKLFDLTIEDTWLRVAKAAAKAEVPANRSYWQKEFYGILEHFQFLPGGRILAGAGTKHDVTLFNCFVMPVADSLKSIFDALKEGALTLQEGGGVGYDFSSLRPSGFPVRHTGTTASGPISFMRIWNAMCGTMLSTSARRGAMMGILRCDHPDIEEFIIAKSDPHELRHFNVSVLVTDDFMRAVKENREWELVFPTDDNETTDIIYRRWSGSADKVRCKIVKCVPARMLWQKIIKSAYDYAEPGVIFEDTINHQNNLWYREWISATNPCGEIPLPSYGACNLGAINLTQFVMQPFSNHASIAWDKLKKTTAIATRFLDNVIDVSRYPLKLQKQEAYATRRIGLGITGLANLFVMLGIRYGSQESLKLAHQVMKVIAETTWMTSIELAKERESFPLFNKEKYLQGNFVQSLTAEIQKSIARDGMRNSHHNTIAPTGTISLLANNVSNGIEPIFSSSYERIVRSAEGGAHSFAVTDYALRLWQTLQKEHKLPPAWVDSQSLEPQDHLQIQAAVQPFIDNAISKTINIPVDFPFEKLTEVYSQAYALGLKGCTIFRPNPVTGSVLTVVPPDEETDRCCQFGS